MNICIENSHDFAREVEVWSEKLNSLMKDELNAALGVVLYYLPHQCTMVGCPLGDPEYKKLGEAMRVNPAIFTAAEATGLLAEGVYAFCNAALDNAGSWSYCFDDIQYLLQNDELRKYVSFSDRYLAKCLIAGGAMLCDPDNEDLWFRYATAAQKKLNERTERGFAY